MYVAKQNVCRQRGSHQKFFLDMKVLNAEIKKNRKNESRYSRGTRPSGQWEADWWRCARDNTFFAFPLLGRRPQGEAVSGLIGVDGWFELSSQAPSRAHSIGIAVDKGTLFFPSRVAIEHSIHQEIWPPLTGMVTDELEVLRNDVTATRLSSYVTRALASCKRREIFEGFRGAFHGSYLAHPDHFPIMISPCKFPKLAP